MELLLSLVLNKPIECNNLCSKMQAMLMRYASAESLENKVISIYVADMSEGELVQKQLLIENKS
jgi:hypothetical protein